MFATHPIPDLAPHGGDDTVLDYRAVFDCEPRMVGPYQLGRAMGHGRLGSTFEVWNLDRRSDAVMKLFTVDADGTQRLALERVLLKRLEAITRIHHPAIVPILELGLVEEGLYVAARAVPGRTLEAALASGWRPRPELAVGIVRALASALACAHEAGVLHGNLHAGQVMLVDGAQPVLTDLGLVQAATGLAKVDSAPHRLGDRACQSPEQRALGRFGPAGDMYALGVLMIRLLVDEKGFVQAAQNLLHTAESGGLWPPIEQLRPDIPAQLAGWITCAVDLDPDQRPYAAEGLPEDVSFEPTAPVPAVLPMTTTESTTRTSPHVARRWMLAGTLASSVAMAGLIQTRPASSPAPALVPGNPPLTTAAGPAPDFNAVIAANPTAAGPAQRAPAGIAKPNLRLDR